MTNLESSSNMTGMITYGRVTCVQCGVKEGNGGGQMSQKALW